MGRFPQICTVCYSVTFEIQKISPWRQSKIIHYTFSVCTNNIQKHIGCDMFTTFRFDKRNTAFCDDEGLINGTDRAVRFVDEVYPQPLAGRVLILGDGVAGESADCTHSAEVVKSKVKHFCEIFQD